MKIAAQIWKTIAGTADDPGETLARLLIAAREDPDFRTQLLAMLRVPAAQREALINTAIHEMRLRGEPAAACAAFAMLASEEGAKAALRVLSEK